MSSIVLQLVAFLCIPLVVFGNKTKEESCRQLVDLEAMSFCCGMDILDKFMFIGTNCTNYWENYGSCRYECLYEHWKLLDANKKIKKPELYTMITKLYNPLNGYQLYATALKEAHTKCEEVATKYSDFVMQHASKTRKQLGLDTNCTTDALLNAQCIMVHLTNNCPEKFWRKMKECDDLRNLIPECLDDTLDTYLLEVSNRPQLQAVLRANVKGASRCMPLGGNGFLLSSLLSLVLFNWFCAASVLN